MPYPIYYRRNLPHFQPTGATFFVTFRLAGSLPRHIIDEIQIERDIIDKHLQTSTDELKHQDHTFIEKHRMFDKYDNALNFTKDSPHWLHQPRVATIVSQSLHFYDSSIYTLHAYSIMPNHVHVVITPLEQADGTHRSLTSILHSLKSYTAHKANKILKRTGEFWQEESYDHVVRNAEEFDRTIAYILYNPYKAGLVEEDEDWPWNYIAPDN